MLGLHIDPYRAVHLSEIECEIVFFLIPFDIRN
jgi:hypothetical protein